jgi:MraZ protein
MFRGSHSTKVDDRGRLKLPADFRRDLPAEQKFYITSFDGKKALLYPLEVWVKQEEHMNKLPSLHPARTKFFDITSFWGQTVDLDNQGRLLLPQKLRDKANLSEDVLVVGKPTAMEPGFMEVVEFKLAEQTASVELTAEDFDAIASFGA